jgi:hypothetical protein
LKGKDMSNKISYKDLPATAWAKISERQKTYIDEFSFYKQKDGSIQAYYAGELVATWDGKSWIGWIAGWG